MMKTHRIGNYSHGALPRQKEGPVFYQGFESQVVETWDLDGILALFVRPDTDGIQHRCDEYLPIADLTLARTAT